MVKQFKVFAVLLAILTVFTGTASAFEGTTTKVRLSVNGSVSGYVDSYAVTVEEFLEEQNVKLGKDDIVEPPLDTEIEEYMKVSVTQAFDVYVCIDNAIKKNYIAVSTTPCTLLEFVAGYKESTGNDYEFDEDNWATQLEEGDVVYLKSVKTVDFTSAEEIAFETVTVEDAELEVGNEVVESEGAAGEKTIITTVTYVGKEETSREVTSEKITVEPVDRVIRIGTMEPEPEPEPENVAVYGDDSFTYSAQYTMTATAYTNDYASTGKNPGDPAFGITASGMKARVGVVAVDPKVIPLGTELYIVGYGYAIAGDTGGAIKGNKIDLFYNTSSECYQFGRRSVTVYVIAD